MSVKISQLSASSDITSDDFFPVVDSGSMTTKRASAEQVLEYITGSTFNTLTVTDLDGTTAQFTTVSSSNLVVSGGNALFYQPVFIDDNAYILYNSSIDKLAIFPGLYVTGAITASTVVAAPTGIFTILTGSTATFTNVGIGTSTPTSKLSVGASSEFQVNSTGDIVKINNVTTTFPAAQGAVDTYLKNDGAGTLTWAAVSGGAAAIGGTITGGTANSILFVNPAATIAQDNPSFTYEDASKHISLTSDAGMSFKASDLGEIINSYNTSAGSANQFFINHNLANVELGNPRGNTIVTSGNLGINVNATQANFAKFITRSSADNLIALTENAGLSSIVAFDDSGASNTLRLAGNTLVMTGNGGAGDEHVRVTSAGYVGIGTTSPT